MSEPKEQIVQLDFAEEMKTSFRDYALSVILARALPDVRDGLKPVQRRILYAMNELGLDPKKPHRKSARIVGDTMGKYHPHGDSSIYDALVHMTEDYSLSVPLVDGHGNFGSIDGDGAAAMRYTEARLSEGAMTMLENLDKGLVEFMPNFDESEKEPKVLPAMLPNLLINGTTGIAVGMATNIPPHNPGEVIDGVIAYIDNPDISEEKLLKYIPGPDFPTGGIITNTDALPEIYRTGEGKIRVRAKTEIENGETEWTRSIDKQIKRMNSLTEKLVMLSRMDEEGYSPNRAEFSLSQAVSDTAHSFDAVAEQMGKKYRVSVEENLRFTGDENAIKQLVSLLTDNAMKYSDEGGYINVSLKKSGKYYELRTENSVTGIEKGNRDILFERFYRSDASRNSATGGHGIGLSVAKAITEAHKGKISAFSPDGKSIIFTALLPA